MATKTSNGVHCVGGNITQEVNSISYRGSSHEDTEDDGVLCLDKVFDELSE